MIQTIKTGGLAADMAKREAFAQTAMGALLGNAAAYSKYYNQAYTECLSDDGTRCDGLNARIQLLITFAAVEFADVLLEQLRKDIPPAA